MIALWFALLAGLAPSRSASGADPSKSGTAPRWESLFDGQTLAGWAQSGFEAEGEVEIVDPFRHGPGAIVLKEGLTLSGVTRLNRAALPRMNYEITLAAMRIAGSDFFCGLTFPVGKSACSFIVGGWGGRVVGISNVDGVDASENETSSRMAFADQVWYRIRVRVTDGRIEAWIDGEKKVDLATAGRRLSLRPGDIQKSLPLGIASYQTRAAIRDIRLRRL